MEAKCPYRHDLPPRPERVASLPISNRGYPVPFFAYIMPDGQPEFRVVDNDKAIQAVRDRLCWVCGKPLGAYKAFVIGPMCTVNKVSADGPCHLECAHYSVIACPFLVKPQMERREKGLPEHQEKEGMIKANPGVMAVWTTRHFSIAPVKGLIFYLGQPEHVTWWKEGRPANREEVMKAFNNGLPRLFEFCQDDEDRENVVALANVAKSYWPPAVLDF